MQLRRIIRTNIGSYPVILFFGILIIVSEIIFTHILHPSGLKEVFRLQTTFSLNDFANAIDNLGCNGTQRYICHFRLDFFFPVFYGMFFAAVISKLLSLAKTLESKSYLLFIPFLAAIFDELENVLEMYILNNIKYINTRIVFISGLFSTIKWSLIVLCFILVIFLLTKVIYTKNRKYIQE